MTDDTHSERIRLVVVVVNAAAAIAIVVMQDPALRREIVETWHRLATRAQTVYHRPRPDPRDVTAVLAEAQTITRDAAKGAP